MNISKEFLQQLDELYQEYEKEVKAKSKEGYLADNTVRTYLLHSGNFVKWCRGDFSPGVMKEKK